MIQTQSEVVPKDLRKYLIEELGAILMSISHSDKLYFELVKQPPQNISVEQLTEYV